ncbi:unnamed protein product [Protopolystoma xenopodis]|uniref:Uncharacterized protein n=1 Tax=Protopolystoma xenopodis TaxID=117903 RepID=A0A448WD33_9PLAT|nr:unnamed protein product [Protopolystoma xenopodis]
MHTSFDDVRHDGTGESLAQSHRRFAGRFRLRPHHQLHFDQHSFEMESRTATFDPAGSGVITSRKSGKRFLDVIRTSGEETICRPARMDGQVQTQRLPRGERSSSNPHMPQLTEPFACQMLSTRTYRRKHTSLVVKRSSECRCVVDTHQTAFSASSKLSPCNNVQARAPKMQSPEVGKHEMRNRIKRDKVYLNDERPGYSRLLLAP